MLHTHLPQILSHLAAVGRDSLTFFHAASRAFVVMLWHKESPHLAFNSAWQAVNRRRSSRKRLPPLLIHYHIFKNAGTSFERGLTKALKWKRVLRLDTPSHDGFISTADIADAVRKNPGIKVVTSHQAVPPPARIPGREVVSSILIRDPIARVRSIYAFERVQQEVHPGTVKAKELDFRAYVEWRLETSPRMFCNFQVHFCSRDRVDDFRMPDQLDLERAICALDKIDIVGTVERYDEWLDLARSVLGEYFKGIELSSMRENVSAERCASQETIYQDLVRDLGQTTARYLLDQNELDMTLYQVADALLTRRLAERRVHLSLRHSYLNLTTSEVSSSSTPKE